MCKKREEIKRDFGVLKRVIITLAFWFLKPKCEACDSKGDCVYYEIKKNGGLSKWTEKKTKTKTIAQSTNS